MVKLQLIYPILDIGQSYQQGAYWGLGLVSLATYVKQKFGGKVEIDIVDGSIHENQQQTLDKLDPLAEIVGIKVESLNYNNGLELAHYAKKNGSKVILGGPHVDALAPQILRNRSFVDYAVVGKGELALEGIIERLLYGKELATIPNLVWRKKDEIVTNFRKDILQEEIGEIDFSFIQLEDYWSKHNVIFQGILPQNPLVVMTHEGCYWRDLTGGCTFCATPQLRFSGRSPELFWEEVEKKIKQYPEIGYIKDFGDTITTNVEYLGRLAETKPVHLDYLPMVVYARAADLQKQKIMQYLKRLNVVQVFVGFESFDNNLLQTMHKGGTQQMYEKAVKNIANEGIKIHASFIVGNKGETWDSVQHTVDFAQKISYCCELTNCAVFLPLPGSPSYKMLQTIVPEYVNSDLLQIHKAKLDWLHYFAPRLFTAEFGNDAEMVHEALVKVCHRVADFSQLKMYVGFK